MLPLTRKIITKGAGRFLATQATTFAEGDMVIVRECSRGGKSALIGPLSASQTYQSRKGILAHNTIIGQSSRTRVSAATNNGSGGQFMVQFPTLDEYVLLCSRRCTPIYPKDASAIVTMLDAGPGDCILEAGTGNAGLTMYLARAVGEMGKVHTVERNSDTSEHAQRVVTQFRRGVFLPSISFHVGVLSEAINGIAVTMDANLKDVLSIDTDSAIKDPDLAWKQNGNMVAPLFDGIVLDMPMPWTQLPHVFPFLAPDRFVVCYLPNISQVMDLVRSIRLWPLIVEDVIEVDWRSWDVRLAVIRNPESSTAELEDAMVCRPTHTPIGHTAFLVKLRKCGSSK
ncbi:hypothetical protein IWW50_000273 [Coemansia erecta]|nr:hypothetical protein GGF43_000414 [Coemansia sp. RSA 2618]KAJ2830454.1 hypothetical protein IWW50_000273 [Coemansia erecta]